MNRTDYCTSIYFSIIVEVIFLYLLVVEHLTLKVDINEVLNLGYLQLGQDHDLDDYIGKVKYQKK